MAIYVFADSYVDTALQEVELPIVRHARCIARYGGIVLDTNICAGGESGKDACGVNKLLFKVNNARRVRITRKSQCRCTWVSR